MLHDIAMDPSQDRHRADTESLTVRSAPAAGRPATRRRKAD